MVKQILWGVAASALAGIAGTALAAEPNYKLLGLQKPHAAAAGAAAMPFGTRAKVAILHSPIIGTLASKGVAGITNPSTGIYCITPSVTLNFASVFPQVTVEWGSSFGSALSAFYLDTAQFGGILCPATDLTVMTFDNSGNPNSNVAFNLIVD